MRTPSNITLVVCAVSVAAACLFAFPVSGATLTWDNSGSSPSAATDGTAALWSTSAANWSNGTADSVWNNANNDIAVFGNANGTAGTVSLGSSVTVGGLIFNAATAGTYTLGTGAYTITLAGALPTVTTNADATISTVLTGTAGLIKSGTGTLFLTATNSNLKGGLTINQGTVSFGLTVNSLGTSSYAITINDGGTLQYTGASGLSNFGAAGTNRPLILGTGTATISSDATGSGYLVIQSLISYGGAGAHTLVLAGGNANANNAVQSLLADSADGVTSLVKNGTGTWKLTGANTYSGSTSINAGTLYIGADNTIPLASTVYVGTSATAATLDLYGHNQAIGKLQDSGNGSGVITNSVNGTGTLTVTSGSFGGAIKDTSSTKVVALTKSGTGTLLLTGSNAYTGATLVSSGTLQFGQKLALYSGSAAKWNASNITVSSGATLALNVGGTGDLSATELATLLDSSHLGASTASTGLLSGAVLGIDTSHATGAVTYSSAIANSNGGANSLGLTKLGANTLILTGSNTYTGATTVAAGELDVNGSLAAESTVTVQSGAVLGGSGTAGGAVNLNSATLNGSGLTVGAATFTGASFVTGSATASRIVVSTGTTLISGSAAAKTSITVSDGATLKNTGTASSNTLSVLTGGTFNNNGVVNSAVEVSGLLSGTGAVNGALTIHSGGVLSPGSSAGVLHVTGDLVVESGAQVSMQLDSLGSYDQLTVTGGVSLGGTLVLTLSDTFLSEASLLASGTTLTLINNDATDTIGTAFSSIQYVTSSGTYTASGSSFTIGATTYEVVYNANGNDLALAVVPEPGAWALMIGGMGCLLGIQRIRRKQTMDYYAK